MNLKQLEKRVSKARQTVNDNRRQGYQTARQCGFSAAEALVLRDLSDDEIRRLAKERKGEGKA